MRQSTLARWAPVALIAAALACQAPSDLAPDILVTNTPVPSPTPTPLPTHTPTPTPTPTPSPTPTPDPGEMLSDATQAMHEGRYDDAAEIYRSLIDLAIDDRITVQSQLGLGTAYLRDGDDANAASIFRELLAAHPESTDPDAHFLLADALIGAGEPLAAAEAYRAYLSAGTVISAYVNKSLGDALYAGGGYTSAIDAYEASIVDAPDRSFEVGTREQIALAHVALEEYDAAVAQYDAILNVAQIPAYRARIEHQAAETLLLAGEIEAGYTRHRTVVETYPTHAPAYHSLVKLVDAGQPVDDFLRGVVDYYGGAYEPAVAALYRYINAYPETHSGDAHWYAGLSFLKADSPELAVNEFDLLIETHPDSSRRGDAWMEKAEAYIDLNETDTALATYRSFVESEPSHPRAPEALWEAAQLLERTGNIEAAAEAYTDCHVEYPDSDYGALALFRSGLQFYQLDELVEAAVAWDTLAHIYPDSPYRPAALLWLGKLRLVQGDRAAARAAFAEASEADAWGYYGLRAAQLTSDEDARPFPSTDYEPAPETTAARDRAEAEQWLADWLALDAAADVGKLGPDLTGDPRLQRGLELWRLGRFEQARGELENLRRATYSDPLTQYRLALTYRDIGLYRSSILCAARVGALSPITSTLDAPVFIARMAYPTYYEDLVLENARRSDLDPLLVFSLIRQESLFESIATSTASAQGLMQVIPPTGAEIAADLGWPPDYETDDLYLPYVSLRFGTYYLAKQCDRFDGRIDAALAAYNGGPFNAQRWLERAGSDPDLFLESITLREPRLYIQRIKEHLTIYRALYGD